MKNFVNQLNKPTRLVMLVMKALVKQLDKHGDVSDEKL